MKLVAVVAVIEHSVVVVVALSFGQSNANEIAHVCG